MILTNFENKIFVISVLFDQTNQKLSHKHKIHKWFKKMVFLNSFEEMATKVNPNAQKL